MWSRDGVEKLERRGQLRENLFDDSTTRVGQTEMAALILVSQPQMVNAKNA
jgi:hypothetical protein